MKEVYTITRKKLIQARLSMELEQADVAEKLKVVPETVSRWERGVCTPYPIHVKALCKLFGKSAQELDLAALNRPRYKLIYARKSMQLSQDEVAEAAKISRKALSNIERGKSNPRNDTIDLLCAYFKMSPQELDLDIVVLTGEQAKYKEPVQYEEQSATTNVTSQETTQADPTEQTFMRALQEATDTLRAVIHQYLWGLPKIE